VVLAGLVFAAAVVLAAAEVWPAVAALSVAHALAVTDLGLRVARRAPS
jgi:hypothetical protein